jgi:hypothetical protein
VLRCSAGFFNFPPAVPEAVWLSAFCHFSVSAKARFIAFVQSRGLNSRLLADAAGFGYQPFAICFPTSFTAILNWIALPYSDFRKVLWVGWNLI